MARSRRVTSRELAARAGLSLQHLHWLVRKGLAEPVKKSRKQGSPSEWCEEDVALITEMVRIRGELEQLGRRRVAPIRLRSLDKNSGLLIVSKDDVVSRVPHDMTVGQLVRTMGCSFAVLSPDSD